MDCQLHFMCKFLQFSSLPYRCYFLSWHNFCSFSRYLGILQNCTFTWHNIKTWRYAMKSEITSFGNSLIPSSPWRGLQYSCKLIVGAVKGRYEGDGWAGCIEKMPKGAPCSTFGCRHHKEQSSVWVPRLRKGPSSDTRNLCRCKLSAHPQSKLLSLALHDPSSQPTV